MPTYPQIAWQGAMALLIGLLIGLEREHAMREEEPLFAGVRTFPIIVLCGYLAARYRMLPQNAVPALNTFVLYFALPCMLFRFASGTAFREIVNIPVFLAYMVTGLIGFGFFAGAMRFIAGETVHDSAFGALAATWSNWGYMGTPLIPALLGRAALAPLIAAVTLPMAPGMLATAMVELVVVEGVSGMTLVLAKAG
jgi:predicted permease